MAYIEYRDARNRLHRVDGPAVESDEYIKWYIDGRLHNDNAPAIITTNGTVLYYWRGIMCPRQLIMDPYSKKPAEIIKIENIEVRRAWMEKYDVDLFMKDMKPKLLHEDKKTNRMLYALKVPNETEPMVMVRLKNSTPEGRWKMGDDCKRCEMTGYIRHEESTETEEVKRTCPVCNGRGKTKMTFVPDLKDGKEYFKMYWVRVPPTMKDANEAVAWSFYQEKEKYKPEVES